MAAILEVKALTKHFTSTSGLLWWKKSHVVKAVDDISFAVAPNEVVGMVGESGCGKSTCGNLLMRIFPPTSGEILYDGRPMDEISDEDEKEFRKKVQLVFQDPYASLDPMMTLYDIIAEPFDIFQIFSREERFDRVAELLTNVGLEPAYSTRYPHELSGGQRQRVAIARALALNPRVIVADEPTSALDVSVKAQIINLLEELKRERGLSILFISHDLSMVTHISDRVIVMYLGKIVEHGATSDLFENPLHPYTKLLIDAIPLPDPRRRKKKRLIKGEVGGSLPSKDACVFYPRCNIHTAACLSAPPQLKETSSGRCVACYHVDITE